MTNPILTFSATFLFHRDAGEGFPIGFEQKIRFHCTHDAMSATIEGINARHDVNPFHIVGAYADEGNFICSDISEIWDANPAIQAIQSIRRHREQATTYPDIYTQQSLDEMVKREGWETYLALA